MNKDDLTCQICFNEYNENVFKPMVLSCGHTICNNCLHGIKGEKNIIKCPICKKEIPRTGSINYLVLGMANNNKDNAKEKEINNNYIDIIKDKPNENNKEKNNVKVIEKKIADDKIEKKEIFEIDEYGLKCPGGHQLLVTITEKDCEICKHSGGNGYYCNSLDRDSYRYVNKYMGVGFYCLKCSIFIHFECKNIINFGIKCPVSSTHIVECNYSNKHCIMESDFKHHSRNVGFKCKTCPDYEICSACCKKTVQYKNQCVIHKEYGNLIWKTINKNCILCSYKLSSGYCCNICSDDNPYI